MVLVVCGVRLDPGPGLLDGGSGKARRGGDDGQVLLGGPAVEGVLPGHQARKLLGQVVEGGLFLGEHRGEPVVGQGQLVNCPSRLDDAVGVLGNGTG